MAKATTRIETREEKFIDMVLTFEEAKIVRQALAQVTMDSVTNGIRDALAGVGIHYGAW